MDPTDTTPRRSRRRIGALVAVLLLVGGVLALTQPWLLLIDDVVAEQLPVTEAAPTDAPTEASTDAPAAAAPDPSLSPGPTAPSTAPVTLLEGSFISREHSTSGAVAVVQLADGSRVLTITGLATDNGPDLYVYLDDDAADAESSAFDDGFDLGPLRGNIGDLVYTIPDALDLSTIASVAIWCDRFSALFGAANLQLAAPA
jgi:hypothetical protein